MEQFNHFTYGQQLVNGLKLFLPHKEKSYHQALNSGSLASISHRLKFINHPLLVAVGELDSHLKKRVRVI
jgi:hypothetical protein